MSRLLTGLAGTCWDLVDYRDRNGYGFTHTDALLLRVMYHLDRLASGRR